MIVEITSWAPTVAFRKPAIPAQTAPPSIPMTVASRMWRNGFIPENDEPIQTAQMLPTMYCPCPPMLNIPQRKAKATARPVRMSVVVTMSVCCRFAAANDSASLTFHGNQTFASLNGSPTS